jgi:hypothetical protein
MSFKVLAPGCRPRQAWVCGVPSTYYYSITQFSKLTFSTGDRFFLKLEQWSDRGMELLNKKNKMEKFRPRSNRFFKVARPLQAVQTSLQGN